MYNSNQMGNYYNPSFAPAYPQISTMGNPSMMQPVTPTVLPGRMVDRLEDIKVSEVPTDNSLGLFPMKDGSCIYAKAWNSDGTIRTMKFVPSEQEDSIPAKESVQQINDMENANKEILERLDGIMDIITSPNFGIKCETKSKNQNGSNSNKE